jgi:formiminotetrahydrofolate cyclodeaminase
VPDLLTTRLISGVAELSEPLANQTANPPGGVATALVVAVAAAVTAAAAERSRSVWDQAPAVRAQAQALRRRALELAARDAIAHAEARQRMAARGGALSQTDDWRLGQAIEAAAQPLLELAACARDVAQLAELLAGHAEGDVRPDAVVAATLCAGAARAAAHLVEINLVAGTDDRRLADVRERVREAESAATSAGEIE